MLVVFFQIIRKNLIIQICYYTLIQHIEKNIINEMMKSCRNIAKSKGHDQRLKMSISGSESSFPSISGTNVDKVVCPCKCNLVKSLAERSLSSIS